MLLLFYAASSPLQLFAYTLMHPAIVPISVHVHYVFFQRWAEAHVLCQQISMICCHAMQSRRICCNLRKTLWGAVMQ